MALNINIEEKAKDITYFSDIRRGEFFLFNKTPFLKLKEVFIVDEITQEVEYERDFIHADDINSNRYNCWLVGSECGYHYMENTTIVERIDVDMNVRYVK